MFIIAQWRSLPRNLDRRNANNFKDALNTGESPFFVSDQTMTDGYGWDFNDYPALKVRNGRSNYGASGAATTRLLASLGNTYLVRVVGTKIQYDNAGTWTDISTGLADGDWDFTNFEVGGNPAVIIVNSGSVPKYWDGTTFGSLGGSPPQASYVTNDNVRVWMAKDDIIYFSAFQDSGDWTTAEDSGFVQYYTERGGNITAIKNFYGDKYVWKNDSMAVVQGTNFFNFRLQDISNEIGCASFRTVQEVGGALFFLGQSNVYQFTGGVPYEIGQPIRTFLDTINPAAISNSIAWRDKEKYYLCVPTGANTDPDSCFVYDTKFRKWLPYSITLGSLRYGINFNNIPYCGDSSGQTFKMNEGTTDAGTAVPWRVQSKPFDDGVPEAEKELWQMYMQGLFLTGTTVTVEIAPDDVGSTWYEIEPDSNAASTATQNRNLIVPLDTVPLCHFYIYRISGSGPATIQEVQRMSRVQTPQY